MNNWYIVQTFSGFEQKVAETIKDLIKVQELESKIDDVLVPTHEVTEVKRGKRVQKSKKYFPSYVLVKMEMSKELYHMIKNIQKVTGFLGTTGTPIPVPEKEIDKISTFLVDLLEEKKEDVQREIDKCINDLNNHKSLHFFTSKINKIYSDENKIELIEILWEIILADGKVHDYESNLITRLAGLLYLNDYECGKAKKKVLLKMGINE